MTSNFYSMSGHEVIGKLLRYNIDLKSKIKQYVKCMINTELYSHRNIVFCK